MGKAIKAELYRLCRLDAFWIMAALSFCICAAAFSQSVISSWGTLSVKQLSWVDQWIDSPGNRYTFFAYQQIVVFFAVPITTNHLYFYETKGRFQSSLICRCSLREYLSAKFAVYAAAAFAIVFLPLVMEAMLCKMCFPAPTDTFFTRTLQPAWRANIWQSAYVNTSLYAEHPFLLILYYSMNCALAAWWMGLLSIVFTVFWPGKRMISILGPFLLHMGVCLLLDMICAVTGTSDSIDILYLTFPHHTGSYWKKALVTVPVYSFLCLLVCVKTFQTRQIVE